MVRAVAEWTDVPAGRLQDTVLRADAGDPAAQASVGMLIEACTHYWVQYPDNAALEEFLSHPKVAENQSFVADVRLEVARCREFRDALGAREAESTDWLVKSARQGYGPALANLAEQALSPFDFYDGRLVEKERDPAAARTLLDAAIRTRHPEALIVASGLLTVEEWRTDITAHPMAWIYAACHFGLDCGPRGFWLQASCRPSDLCGESYARDLLTWSEYMYFTPREVEMAYENAPRLIEHLRDGTWEQVSVGLPGDPALDAVMDRLAEADSRDGDARD